ncbi:MAG: helix-turn-helix domain-containing protein, partial [Candidatus Sericytochromatia bacterium]
AIAERLLRSITTIEDYLMELADAGEIDLSGAVSPEVRRQIEEAADRAGGDRLRPIKELLPASISYFAIRLVLHDRVAL